MHDTHKLFLSGGVAAPVLGGLTKLPFSILAIPVPTAKIVKDRSLK
jgi:hypothetical protein